uniref:Uncharacterized protein n=1 Tax=Phlebotomus papatasi TaxID=29031 RepID=A0A1B0DLA2_PHLPP
MWDLNEIYFGSDRDKFQDDLVNDLAFFNGLCSSCKICIQQNKSECRGNFSETVEKFRTKCEDLITNCAWNGHNFSCCDAFLPLKTEFGQCYTINSIHTNPQYGMKLINNRQSGPGSLYIFALEDIQIHLHSSYAVPYINTEHDLQETILWGLQKEILFKTVELFNDENLHQQKISQRRCRFSSEFSKSNKIKLFDVYSYSTCITTCVAEAQIELCNCTHHLMPENKLSKYFINLIFYAEKLTKIRRDCKCIASCEEPEYNIVYSSNDYFGEDMGSPITISMSALPTTRFIRHTVRTTLDFISEYYFGISKRD